MLGNFPPFTTMQELNLDWILTKIKNILRFVPDDGAVGQILRRTRSGAEWSDEQGAGGSVTSVNGMQGAVVLTAADVGALPDTYVAPVDSVNGQTGDVVLTIPDSTSDLVNDSGFVNAAGAAAASPVQSVNGQTGAVVIPTGNPLDAYPVGSIYMSVNSTSPATIFGGTWEQLEGTWLVAAGTSANGKTYTAGTVYNEELPNIKGRVHSDPIRYSFGNGNNISNSGALNAEDARQCYAGNYLENGGLGTLSFNASLSDSRYKDNGVVQPQSLAVYMWKRTA